MIFRRGQVPAQRQVPSESLEARYAALGRLLDARGYSLPALCIVGTETGFIVHGYRATARLIGQEQTLHTDAIHSDEVTSEVTSTSGGN